MYCLLQLAFVVLDDLQPYRPIMKCVVLLRGARQRTALLTHCSPPSRFLCVKVRARASPRAAISSPPEADHPRSTCSASRSSSSCSGRARASGSSSRSAGRIRRSTFRRSTSRPASLRVSPFLLITSLALSLRADHCAREFSLIETFEMMIFAFLHVKAFTCACSAPVAPSLTRSLRSLLLPSRAQTACTARTTARSRRRAGSRSSTSSTTRTYCTRSRRAGRTSGPSRAAESRTRRATTTWRR